MNNIPFFIFLIIYSSTSAQQTPVYDSLNQPRLFTMRDNINNQQNIYVVIDYYSNGNIEKITEFGYPHVSRESAYFTNAKYEIKNQIIYNYDDQRRIVEISGKSNCIDCQITTSGSMLNQQFIYDENNRVAKTYLFDNMIYRYKYNQKGQLVKQELLDEKTGIIQYYTEMHYTEMEKNDITKFYLQKVSGINDFYLDNTITTSYDNKNSIGQFFTFPLTERNYFNPFNFFNFSTKNNIVSTNANQGSGRMHMPNINYLMTYNNKDFPAIIKSKSSDNMEYTIKIDYSDDLGKYDLYNYFLSVNDKENFDTALIKKKTPIYQPTKLVKDEEFKNPKIEDFLGIWTQDRVGNKIKNLTISNIFRDNDNVGITFNDATHSSKIKMSDLTDDGRYIINEENQTTVIKREVILLKDNRLRVNTTTYEKANPERPYSYISYLKIDQKLLNTATNIIKPLPTKITGVWWNNDSVTAKFIKRLTLTKEKVNPNVLYVYAASKGKNFSDYMMKIAKPSEKNDNSYDFELSDNDYSIIANLIFENGKIKVVGEAKKKPGLKKTQFIMYLEQQ